MLSGLGGRKMYYKECPPERALAHPPPLSRHTPGGVREDRRRRHGGREKTVELRE